MLVLGSLAAATACGGSDPTPVAPDDMGVPRPDAEASSPPSPTPSATEPPAVASAAVKPEPTPAEPPPAPQASSAPASDPSGLDVADANISMGSVSADGFTMTNVACKSEGGGLGALMLGPAIAATIGSKKAQLRACSPKGGEARVLFTMAHGKTDHVEAKAASPDIEKCVTKVMKTVPAPMDATCASTLQLGK